MENLTAKQLLNELYKTSDIKNDDNSFKTYDIYKVAAYCVINFLDNFEVGDRLYEYNLELELLDEITSLFVYDYDFTRLEMDNASELYRLWKFFKKEWNYTIDIDRNNFNYTLITFVEAVAKYIILEQLTKFFINENCDYIALDERNFKEIVTTLIDDEHVLNLRHIIDLSHLI